MENKIWELLQGKKILITGGTGFLGKTITSEILKYEPKNIKIYSRDEVKHFLFHNIFGDHEKIDTLIGNIRDYNRILWATKDIDIVIHAAALKRIDLIEYYVSESVKTNVVGTLNVANACIANNISKAVFVSTDKACSPLNSYGASKLLGERIFTEMNYSKKNSDTILTNVRFGNVLASTGSVIPFFINKIEKNVPIPLTHKDMTRFIISSKEAAHLIFKALIFGSGGEVAVPNLPSMKIPDLIDILKEVYDADNEVIDIGIRPGEKLHEIMLNAFESLHTYKYKDIYTILPLIKNKYETEIQVYVKEGKLYAEGEGKEFSSEHVTLPKKELHQHLKDKQIL